MPLPGCERGGGGDGTRGESRVIESAVLSADRSRRMGLNASVEGRSAGVERRCMPAVKRLSTKSMAGVWTADTEAD